MKLNFLFFAFTLLSAITLVGQQELPIRIDNAKIKPLRKLVDSSLQANLEREIASHSDWNRLISQKKMAVGIVDLSNPEEVRFASVNGNHMMYAASLPKIPLWMPLKKVN